MTRAIQPSSRFRAYILVGPTATGKTKVAQWIAERKGWAILSADSMLVYRGMSIGTAKPTMQERGGVEYGGIDLVTPCDSFSAGMFVDEARRYLESLHDRQELIIVGGTGLYLRALLEGLSAEPDVSPGIRMKWRGVLEREGIDGLQRALQEKNQVWYDSLADKQNPRRLIRALEGVDAGRQTPPRAWRDGKESPMVAGLTMDRRALWRRIEERVQRMYGEGLLDEARSLMELDRPLSATALQAIGYKEALACTGGDITDEEAIAITTIRTRQLAKRQWTWFRRQMSVRWVELQGDESVEDVASRVLAIWGVTGPTPLGI